MEKQKPIIKALGEQLSAVEERKFLEEIRMMPKLRTYKEIKLSLDTETYVKANMPRYNRSLLAKFRTGTFPINLELGRYKRLPVAERKCIDCPDCVEDEYHFLLECPTYTTDRVDLFREIADKTRDEIEQLPKERQFARLMSDDTAFRPVARYLQMALYKRNNRHR